MITVLRIGHRKYRDRRISTHCGLVSRALGADEIIYSGEHDESLINSIKKVTDNFGGQFKVRYEERWRPIITHFKGTIVHLTMYGLPVQHEIKKIKESENILVIVGGEKVPPEVYQLADYNIAVTNQPHSEIAALSIFLHEYAGGKELDKTITGKKTVIPQAKGKKVIE